MESTELLEGPQGTLSTLCDLLQSFAWDLDVALSIMVSIPPGSVLGVPSEARGQMGAQSLVTGASSEKWFLVQVESGCRVL